MSPEVSDLICQTATSLVARSLILTQEEVLRRCDRNSPEFRPIVETEFHAVCSSLRLFHDQLRRLEGR